MRTASRPTDQQASALGTFKGGWYYPNMLLLGNTLLHPVAKPRAFDCTCFDHRSPLTKTEKKKHTKTNQTKKNQATCYDLNSFILRIEEIRERITSDHF